MSYARQQYQKSSTISAPPEKLVDKLYTEGIRACHQEELFQVQRVLTELSGALDMEKGGDLAERLASIYDYCGRAIQEEKNFTEVREIFEELRAGWREGVLGEAEPTDDGNFDPEEALEEANG